MTVDNSDQDNNADSGSDDSNEGADNSNRTFSQKELSEVAAREKREGKKSATRELAERLGVGSIDEAESLLKEARDRKEAELTEVDRERNAATAAKQEADQEKAAARTERMTLRTERHLLRAGAPTDKEGAIEKMARMLDVSPDDDEATISEAVDNLKKDFPELFKPGTTQQVDSDTGGKHRNSGGKAPDANTRAMDRLAKRHPGTIKT